ncbi:MAG: homoserine dehydrogenase [Propionibacteriaceae bacterium]|jgi:homoserine dehydrogenase|nr:homoserine dehydrogenase [Propionibacteriaceae bacterium]
MSRNYQLALIGFGNVNRSLAEMIVQDGGRLAAELGFSLTITAITDLRLGSIADAAGLDMAQIMALTADQNFSALPGGRLDLDMESFIRAAPADIVVEATFTNPVDGQPAVSHCRWAIESGKSVVTTNKGPVAFAAAELTDLAAHYGVGFEFEGSVMSGTPVIRLAQGPLKGVGITGFAGILNGTSNYVLTRMAAGLSQLAAIEEAQDFGYAEADPTADIGGSDVLLKVIILADRLLGAALTPADVQVEGISGISSEMVATASANGQCWKLIGQARRNEQGQVEASVSPQLLPAEHPLAAIPGATNAVMFDTDYLGAVTISGPGAGRTETAFALLSDIVALDARLGR